MNCKDWRAKFLDGAPRIRSAKTAIEKMGAIAGGWAGPTTGLIAGRLLKHRWLRNHPDLLLPNCLCLSFLGARGFDQDTLLLRDGDEAKQDSVARRVVWRCALVPQEGNFPHLF
jgi:hypothetical protein